MLWRSFVNDQHSQALQDSYWQLATNQTVAVSHTPHQSLCTVAISLVTFRQQKCTNLWGYCAQNCGQLSLGNHWYGIFPHIVVISFCSTHHKPMGSNQENMANEVRWYIQGMQIFVLVVYCCVISHCHRATEPDITIFLGAAAGFCDEDMSRCCSTLDC